jgi:NAD(P)H-flavin reductase
MVHLVRVVSDDPGFTDGEQGRISDVVCRHGPWRDHDFFVSGLAPMVNATLRDLAEMQIPSTRIKYDVFTDA